MNEQPTGEIRDDGWVWDQVRDPTWDQIKGVVRGNLQPGGPEANAAEEASKEIERAAHERAEDARYPEV